MGGHVLDRGWMGSEVDQMERGELAVNSHQGVALLWKVTCTNTAFRAVHRYNLSSSPLWYRSDPFPALTGTSLHAENVPNTRGIMKSQNNGIACSRGPTLRRHN